MLSFFLCNKRVIWRLMIFHDKIVNELRLRNTQKPECCYEHVEPHIHGIFVGTQCTPHCTVKCAGEKKKERIEISCRHATQLSKNYYMEKEVVEFLGKMCPSEKRRRSVAPFMFSVPDEISAPLIHIQAYSGC